MTTTETVPEREAVESTASLGPDTAARAHLTVAPVLFAVGLAVWGAVAIKLVEPGFLSGSAFTSYGRLLPIGTNLLLWGWLTPALLGAAFYMVPRMAGAALRPKPLALASLPLVAGGAVAGVVAVGAGHTSGGRLLELPIWADALIAVGIAAAAVSITATARAGNRESLPVAQWYFVAATWWLLAATVVGAVVPFFDGLGASVTGWFSVTAVVGLWLAAAGLGTAYYLVSVLVPGARFHPLLGRIGFWSLALAWAWTAPRVFLYGPTPEWLETTPVVFSLALVVAVLTILTDFARALRGRWPAVAGSTPLVLVVIGLGLLAVAVGQMLVAGFRGASAVVHFTAWETAFEQLVLLGPFGFFAAASVIHALGSIRGRSWGRVPGLGYVWATVAGLIIVLASRWIAGLQQGYTWIAGVNSGEYPNHGAGFRNSVAPLEGMHWLQVIGFGILLVGAGFFLAGLVRVAPGRASGSGDDPWGAPPQDAGSQSLRTVAQGAALVFALALIGVVVVPISEVGAEPSLLAEDTRDLPAGSAAFDGREIYLREGCWYCHTQQVRAAVTDVGLGTVSVPGDYVFDPADLLGLERIGPDLAHIGSRFASEPEWRAISPTAYLESPGSGRPWSIMPAYDHLSAAELDALAAYLAELE